MRREVAISINIIDDNKWRGICPHPDKVTKSVIRETIGHLSLNFDQMRVAAYLANDSIISELNSTYRGKSGPTNVLSFPYAGVSIKSQNIPNHVCIGEIVLSVDTIIKEAYELNISSVNHFTHLIIHGVLHLLGHNHENEDEAQVMEAIEIELLARYGIDNPYAN